MTIIRFLPFVLPEDYPPWQGLSNGCDALHITKIVRPPGVANSGDLPGLAERGPHVVLRAVGVEGEGPADIAPALGHDPLIRHIDTRLVRLSLAHRDPGCAHHKAVEREDVLVPRGLEGVAVVPHRVHEALWIHWAS